MASARLLKRLVSEARDLRIDVSRGGAQDFLDEGIGAVFRYRSPQPEFGSWDYAVGPRGTKPSDVLRLLQTRYSAAWEPWTIERLGRPGKPRRSPQQGHKVRVRPGTQRNQLATAVRRDK